MSISLLFWILYIVGLVFGLFINWPAAPGAIGFRGTGYTLLLFILIGLLGWHVFGPAIRS